MIHVIIRMIQTEVSNFFFLLYFCCLFLHQMTPLHAAAEKGCFNIIKPLVDKGANINIEDNDGVIERQ